MKKSSRLAFLVIAALTKSCFGAQPLPDDWWLQDSPEKVLAMAQAINQSLTFFHAEKFGSTTSEITCSVCSESLGLPDRWVKWTFLLLRKTSRPSAPKLSRTPPISSLTTCTTSTTGYRLWKQSGEHRLGRNRVPLRDDADVPWMVGVFQPRRLRPAGLLRCRSGWGQTILGHYLCVGNLRTMPKASRFRPLRTSARFNE